MCFFTFWSVLTIIILTLIQNDKYYLKKKFKKLGEEFDSRYSNLFYPIEKQHMHSIESLPHPPIIALIMRRSSGIQALECHVLLARSTLEAKSIVACIRSLCNKLKQEQSQQSHVFQYKPYIDPTEENHLDLITDLNTSSNALMSSSKHHNIYQNSNNMDQ